MEPGETVGGVPACVDAVGPEGLGQAAGFDRGVSDNDEVVPPRLSNGTGVETRSRWVFGEGVLRS